jgi:uncharacterized membrane protein YidH (DUF202 family)
MVFGFVVARFGLFLQALQIGPSNFQARPYSPSFWFGTVLIVVGVIVNIVCAWSHIRLVRESSRRNAKLPCGARRCAHSAFSR